MGFLWRRRSSLVKIVILLSAVWFTIAFLIYSEDRRSSGTGPSAPHHLPLNYKNDFNEFNEGGHNANINEINGLDSVMNNVISNSNSNDKDLLPYDGSIKERKHHSNHNEPETIKNAAADENGMIHIFITLIISHLFYC